LQIKGAPGKPYTIVGDPTTAPGVAANVGSYGFDGAVYWQKWGTTNTDWKPITGTYSYQTDEDYYKSRASALLASPRLTCWWWDDFLEPSGEKWFASLSATGTWSTKYNDCGVSVLKQTNPTASGDLRSSIFMGNEADAAGNFLDGTTNGVWYVAHRSKIINANIANQCYFGLDSLGTYTAGRLYFGDVGGASTNWGIYTLATGTVLSAVANDGGTHLHELYRVGGVTKYLLDGVEILSGDYFPNGAAMYLYFWIQSAVNVDVTWNIDLVAAAVGGNNPRTIT
jgi:hypothetical protein